MNLVVNASPLILLGKVGQIDLLRRLCDTVCVPEGVVGEIEMEKDAEGKACALAFGLNPLGTGGLLVLAKRAGLLSSVHPVLRELRTQGFWISDGIIQTILHLTGESTAPCDEA